MDYSMPGFPVLHYLLEFAQTSAHWVGDAIQPSHPLLPLLLLPSVFPSIGVFSNESALCILFMDHTFHIVSKKSFSFFLLQHLLYCSGLEWNPNLFLTQHAPFPPEFYSSFMVLVFSFRLFLHFEFFFVWGAYGYSSSIDLSLQICSKLIVHICPMDKGAWRPTVHGVTRESDMT